MMNDNGDLYNINILENILKYKFKSLNIIKEALTHPSSNQKKKDTINNFQRLEFLGDSVLDLIVSEHVYQYFKNISEGKLTEIKSILVSKKILSKWANQISLGSFIILGKGEVLTGGRNKISILADCWEALIGAVYLDSDFQTARQIFLPYIKKEIKLVIKDNYFKDYKSLLQEVVQKKMNCLPTYHLLKEKGPGHCKIFSVMVKINNSCFGVGMGDNKKEAEKHAAQKALNRLGIIN